MNFLLSKRFLGPVLGFGIGAALIGPIEKETLQEIAVSIFEANDAVIRHGDGRYPPQPQETTTLSLDAH